MSSAQLFRKADHGELAQAEHVRRIYWHTPKAGVSPADLMVPAYWERFAYELRPNDRVECCPRDSSWFAELLVRSCGAEGVVMMGMRGANLDDNYTPPGLGKPQADIGEVEITHEGPLLKWAAKAKADGRMLKSGFATRDEASAWLAQHREMLARTSRKSQP